uniref:CAF17 C-terminal domain-containing protein n=1 Tax=Caenorhabditis japonica TaxID=281687 RepID=A0A8R1E0J1_CAEJA
MTSQRLIKLPHRVLLKLHGADTTAFLQGLVTNDVTENVEKYENLRRAAGIAEGAGELADLLPFQANGDLLNMVALDKGCYIGQELTARTAHTGVIRRRIMPFECQGQVRQGADILDEKKNKVGKVISSDTSRCLGILQLSSFKLAKLTADDVALTARQPEWMPDKILANNKTRTSLTDA